MLKSPYRIAAGVLLLFLFGAAAQGQTASLARDINSTGPGAGGSPRSFYAVPGKLFFFGDGIGARGFWVTDGTSAGTTLLTDFCPSGSCSFSPGAFIGDVGGTVLWIAESEDRIPRLWRSDGTRGGTYPLTGPGTGIGYPQISPGSVLRAHAFFKGAFYFRACDTEECKSYRSDGNAAGTVEIPLLGHELVPVGDLLFSLDHDDVTRDYLLRVTADPSGGSTVLKRFTSSYRPNRFTAAGSRLFFTASEGAQSQELWVSDGTAAGTRAVTDFVPSLPFEGRDWLKPAGNRVYFVAYDVIHGEEIWVSDGTPQGTRRATDFGFDTPFSSRSSSMEEVNGRLVFIASDGIHPVGLWTTTGSPESVTSLPVEFEYYESDLKKSGGRLFFQLTDLEHGGELWATDGTAAGTGLVDLCPGPCYSMSYSDQVLPWPGGVLLMGADDGVHGREIWLSDGTRAGTRRITDFEDYNAVQASQFAPPVSFNGRIWFASESFFVEGGLWSTDGNPASTRMVAHLGRSEPTSEPEYLTAAGGRLYFAAHDGTVHGLWSTLGPPETTVLVKAAASEPFAGGEIQGVAAAGSLVFFWERAFLPFGPQEQLWRTDGTPAGTFLLSSEEELSNEGVGFQGKLYIPAWTELWASDGTVQGTGPFFSHPEGVGNLAVAGGALYFTAGSELWRTDGTVPGTRKLQTIPGIAFLARFVTSGPLVFFTAGEQLWKTDGTPAGTVQVAIPGFHPTDLTAFEGGVAFLAYFGNSRALFVSDGTAAGSVMVKAFRSDSSIYVTPSSLTAFAGRLYLSADDGEHGSELWTSDGTAASTVMVRDIAPGWRSSFPRRLTVAGGRLFFVAGDGVHGAELWVSDGTAAGTRMVQDLNPYANASEPEQLTAAGDRLYFAADDGTVGRELWSFPLAAGPGCQPAATRLCLNNGRFQVDAAWRDFQGHRGTGQAVALTADTGYFWFFSPSNVEAVLKVLDGRGLNDHFWVFYGALSSVEYYLTVTDTQTGAAKRYYNPPGQLASVGDTKGFGPLGAFSSKKMPKSLAPLTLVDSRVAPATGPCQPTAERLCLNGGRFAVEANWKDFQGKTGTGKATSLTGDTGWFWFFDAANLEVMIKVLDGTSLNGKHWVFYGALSSVEYTLTVTDTVTGKQNTYRNPSGRFGSVADTNAF